MMAFIEYQTTRVEKQDFLTKYAHEAEAVSLALSVSFCIMGSLVIYKWAYPAYQALKTNTGKRDHIQWLLLGVFLSFVSKQIDCGYWGLPWSLMYVGHPAKDYFMRIGVWFNIPFRNILGIIAAYCHLRGFASLGKNPTNSVGTLNKITAMSLLIGVVVVFFVLPYLTPLFDFLFPWALQNTE